MTIARISTSEGRFCALVEAVSTAQRLTMLSELLDGVTSVTDKRLLSVGCFH